MEKKIAFKDKCKSKTKFVNQQAAEKRAKEINDESDITLYFYQCNSCDGWHLTKRTPDEQRKIRKKITQIQDKYDCDYESDLIDEADFLMKKSNKGK